MNEIHMLKEVTYWWAPSSKQNLSKVLLRLGLRCRWPYRTHLRYRNFKACLISITIEDCDLSLGYGNLREREE